MHISFQAEGLCLFIDFTTTAAVIFKVSEKKILVRIIFKTVHFASCPTSLRSKFNYLQLYEVACAKYLLVLLLC